MVGDVVGEQNKVRCVPLTVVLPPSCVTNVGMDNQKIMRVQQVMSRDQHMQLNYE